MGYWTNTTYVNHRDPDAVAGCLIQLFEAEGMRQVPRPPERERVWYEPMQYATSARNNLWGVAVFPGAEGWTVIKSAPLELLAERPARAGRMRLVELCDRLAAPGAMLNVYDSSGSVLVEADGKSGLALSGLALGSGQNSDATDFYGEVLSEDRYVVGFGMLPLQHVVEDCERDFNGYRFIDHDKLAHALETLLGAQNSQYCDNLTSVHTLICHRPLAAIGGKDLYFEWPCRDRDEPARRTWDQVQEFGLPK
jgi:hypothetical protein